MKKLLITNLITAVVVLGIIAAYSFSKPEQTAGAKYATVQLSYANGQSYVIEIYQDGNYTPIVQKTQMFSGKVEADFAKARMNAFYEK